MIRRSLEFVLLVLLIFGGFQAWSTARERSRLEAEYQRLIKATGDFTIIDPTKIQILAVPTGDPHHFAWHIYVPPNYNQTFWRNSIWHGGNMTGKSKETLGHIRILEEDGVLNAFDTIGNTRGLDSIGDSKLADFLRTRWDQLQVEQAGANGVITVDPADPIMLLRLTMPQEMEAEARRLFSESENLESVPKLFSFGFGPRVRTERARFRG